MTLYISIKRTVAVLGAALTMSVMAAGSAGALSTTSAAINDSVTTETYSSPATAAAMAAPSDTDSGHICPTGYNCIWKVVAVYKDAGESFRPWYDCNGWSSSPWAATVGCDITKSEDHTTSAEVAGTDGVGLGSLSASVGYSVTKTSSINASWSAVVPARSTGVVQDSSVYNNLRTVRQRFYTCQLTRFGENACVATNRYANAYTEQYSHSRFRAYITGANGNIVE